MQVAANVQSAVVSRRSNTCIYVIAIFTIVKVPNNAFASIFVVKSEITATETNKLLQQAYGEDAMGRTKVF